MDLWNVQVTVLQDVVKSPEYSACQVDDDGIAKPEIWLWRLQRIPPSRNRGGCETLPARGRGGARAEMLLVVR